LAVDPNDALIVFAGTSSGAFTTGDGGEIWGATGSFTAVDAMLVDSGGNAYLGYQAGAYVLPKGTTQWGAFAGTQWVNALAFGTGTPPRLYCGIGQLPFDTGAVGYSDGLVFHRFDNGLSGITVNSIAVDTMNAESRILLGTVGLGLVQ